MMNTSGYIYKRCSRPVSDKTNDKKRTCRRRIYGCERNETRRAANGFRGHGRGGETTDEKGTRKMEKRGGKGRTH